VTALIALWLALQVPLAVLVGRYLRHRTEPVSMSSQSVGASPPSVPRCSASVPTFSPPAVGAVLGNDEGIHRRRVVSSADAAVSPRRWA
jgi:ABC-type multidrug transport system permease subunit